MASKRNEASLKARTLKRSTPSKLDRTLKELEAAFSDWESLSQNPKARVTRPEDVPAASKASDVLEKDFRKRTRKLLNQLRQQLAELND